MNQRLAVPTPQQMAWQDLELGMFFHFGINTYCDQEWGDGTDSPELFNPAELDARQWIGTAKEAGFKYVILTAKHHDGFCLWPTKTTDYSVRSSPWRNGQGDVVREVADACREEGMKFGLYVSPWDRNAPCYADPAAYDDFYAEQLTELLTGYGPLVEVWFDGAGSEGREYDWKRIIGLVKRHQPDAMIFNMGAPTIRWVGNEDGVAPYPCWNTAESARVSMFTSDMNTWMEETPGWVPAECDVPIRKRHWFWHPNDEHSLHSLDHLMDLYYRSVGHGTTLLLNVSPDNRGLLPEPDAKRVLEFGAEIRRRFGQPLGSVSGTGSGLELALDGEALIDHILTMEDIAYGERVRAYTIEAEAGGKWKPVAAGSAIGHKKIDRIEPTQTSRIRIRVTEEAAEPHIRSLAAYSAGE
ncbi:alpha-L-fucosidase [Paenibacillus dendritiformis]|uniref:alpha-L-fucosidase n=1 Tax=Paenibacillus dendritiformis TaxID=130049 RepID=UPI00143D5BB0|nr:alpha-L-fucosidase [Paenibacillus dendritiformis]NKI20024.1 alpha-L-fucosidase [Paenibacillus dendritiformis]NRF99079.1 alpha-L-fucosidase [Paenibacillus dendritiformis]GIO76222.1 alpha-L-fucosidase [Paenibacillus dendritiformis]